MKYFREADLWKKQGLFQRVPQGVRVCADSPQNGWVF